MPTSWTIPGESRRARLVEHMKTSIPRFVANKSEAEIEAIARGLDLVAGQVEDWTRNTYVLNADGRWLRALAKDRGVSPQDGESDPSLRARIRHPEDVVTRPALLAASDAITGAVGLVGSARMVELPLDAAFVAPAGVTTATAAGFAYCVDSVSAPALIGTRITRAKGGTIIVVLPAGAPRAVIDAVREAVRIKKAAGFAWAIEVNPATGFPFAFGAAFGGSGVL